MENCISSPAFLLLCLLMGEVSSVPPAKMAAPTLSSVESDSLNVEFVAVSGAKKYYVTIALIHGNAEKTCETMNTYLNISDLTAGTLYSVTVKAENSEEEIGDASDPVTAFTLPEAPTLRLGTPLSDSLEIFFGDQPRVSHWTVQYRILSSGSIVTVNSAPNTYYTVRLTGLTADTEYEVMAFASQLDGNSIEGAARSNWQQFKTDSLSIFGSVVFPDVAFVADHERPYSAEWNSSLAAISQGYVDQSIDHNGISIIRIESRGGKALAHYRVKVKDKTLPSETNYTLTGAQFNESFINNGDKVRGTTYIFKTGTKYTLTFDPETTCAWLIERYMVVSPENSNTLQIHLNVASSSATTADEEDSLNIESNGNLVLDDGETYTTLAPGTVLGLTPRFLMKSCLQNETSVPLYAEYFSAIDADTNERAEHFLDQIDPAASLLNTSAVTYSSSTDGQSVTLNVPAVRKAIKYAVMNGTTVMATLNETNIDGSNFLKISVASLNNGTAYNFNLRVTLRKWNGAESEISVSGINVTPSSSQCAKCSSNSCVTYISGELECLSISSVELGITCLDPQNTATTEPTRSKTSSMEGTTPATSSGLPAWAIALIVLGTIILIIVVATVAFAGKGQRNKKCYHRGRRA